MSRSTLIVSVCVATVLGLGATALPASAQSEGAATVTGAKVPALVALQAKKKREDAVKLFRSKDYVGARLAYEASYQLEPSPAALRGIASCLTLQGRAAEAVAAYEKLLQVHGAQLNPRERAAVEKALLAVADKTGTLAVTGAPVGASIEIDGKVVAQAPLPPNYRLDAGSHAVRLRAEGWLALDKSLEITAGLLNSVDGSMTREVSTGHVLVRASDNKPARVVVDGLEVGEAPFSFHAPAGRYQVALAASGAVSEAKTLEVLVGQEHELLFDVPVVKPPPAPPLVVRREPPPRPKACEFDADCGEAGRLVCVERQCRKPVVAREGEACDQERSICGEGLTCARSSTCLKPQDIPPHWRGGLAVAWNIEPGLAGDGSNPVPSHSVGLDFFRGSVVITHVSVQYMNLNGYKGARFKLPLGIPIQLAHRDNRWLFLEPGLDLIDFSVMYKNGDYTQNTAGFGAWIRLRAHTGHLFGELQPLGVSYGLARQIKSNGDSETIMDTNLNYSVRLAGGVTF